MFEEVCLTCGKPLVHDSWRAYCSDECLPSPNSPSSSSVASSAYSSPILFAAHGKGGDVPPLSKGALGPSLHTKYHGVYTTTSSSSSTSWSADTDEEDALKGEDNGTTPSSFQHISQAGIYYTRRPSMTAHPSTPTFRARSSYGLGVTNNGLYPQSAPHGSHVVRSGHKDGRKSSGNIGNDTNSSTDADALDSTVKDKRSRNRTSLPAYFSLMKMSGTRSREDMTHAGSPNHRVSRPSSPVPTFSHAMASPSGKTSPVSLITLTRGRRREAGPPRATQQSSPSRSPSRTRYHVSAHQNSVEKVSEWTNTMIPAKHIKSHPRHGQAVLSSDGMQRHVADAPVVQKRESSRRSSRGRAHVDELDGIGTTENAPGYGHGRSGLLSRERRAIHHHRR